MVTEAILTAAFCLGIGGVEEVRHNYPLGYVKVDCETQTEVFEAGLDKRSSLDSVQQAQFFHLVTGKEPVVVIFDTDGKVGKYEYRIKSVARSLGIKYLSIDVSN